MTARGVRAAPAMSIAALLCVLVAWLVDRLPISIDESVFADPAWSGAQGHGFGSPLLAATLPGAGERVMWQPPGHPVLLAGWFRVLGFGLIQGRLLSAFACCLLAAGLFVIGRRYASDARAALAVAFGIATPWVTESALTIRMESLTGAAIVWSFAAYLAWCDDRRPRSLALAACLAAAAVLCHPIGALACVVITAHLVVTRAPVRAIVAFVLGVAAVVVVLWGAFALGYWSELGEQMRLQLERKNAGFDWVFLARGNEGHALIALLVAGALLSALRAMKGEPDVAFLVIWLLVAIAAATVGGEPAYPFYVAIAAVPLVAFAMSARSGRTQAGIAVLAAVVAAIELGNTAHDNWSLPSARATAAALSATIPEHASAFLGPGGEPAYFAHRPGRRLSQWVPVGSFARQAEAARRDDYLVMNPIDTYPELLQVTDGRAAGSVKATPRGPVDMWLLHER